MLDRLLDTYIWDINMGGYGLSDGVMPETILEYVKPDALATVRQRVAVAQRRKAESKYGQWGVEAYESFLIQLDAPDNIDPEITLQRLREQGLYRLLFGKLLSIGRVEDAVVVITKHLTTPFEWLQVLPVLSAAGHDDMAFRLARETVESQFDDRLAHWLAERYAARGDRNALFNLGLIGMRQNPSEAYYAALEQAAETVGTWQAVRPEIIRQLKNREQFEALTRVYLHDQEWDRAWDTLARMPRSPRGWMNWSRLDFEVAERSRHTRPQKAIPVYMDYARREINARSRNHYAQAARYLAVARDLYRQSADETAWRSVISEIREGFRWLPVLQDELNKSKL
jgi:hypothetical protein